MPVTLSCVTCGGPLPRGLRRYCCASCKYAGMRRPPKTADELRAELEAQSIPIPFCGCIVWLGAVNDKGYGTIRLAGAASGGKLSDYVHRVSYELEVGPIPEGLELDHLCRVHGCRNVQHLEPVTSRENTARGNLSARRQELREQATHCRNGHPFTPENTMRTGPKKWRRCRICHYAARNRSERRGPYATIDIHKDTTP